MTAPTTTTARSPAALTWKESRKQRARLSYLLSYAIVVVGAIVVFFPFVMAVWLGGFLRVVWRDRQKAKRAVARRAKRAHAE